MSVVFFRHLNLNEIILGSTRLTKKKTHAGLCVCLRLCIGRKAVNGCNDSNCFIDIAKTQDFPIQRKTTSNKPAAWPKRSSWHCCRDNATTPHHTSPRNLISRKLSFMYSCWLIYKYLPVLNIG